MQCHAILYNQAEKAWECLSLSICWSICWKSIHWKRLFHGRACLKTQKSLPTDCIASRPKKQRTRETRSGDTHLTPPGGSSLDLSHKQNTDPLSSSMAEVNNPSPGGAQWKAPQMLKAVLPPGQYKEMRSAILRHQVFPPAHSKAFPVFRAVYIPSS